MIAIKCISSIVFICWTDVYLDLHLSVVATTIKNANVALIFSFLHRIVEVSCMLHRLVYMSSEAIYGC